MSSPEKRRQYDASQLLVSVFRKLNIAANLRATNFTTRHSQSGKEVQVMEIDARHAQAADSEIGIVDGVFMLDGPSINHHQQAMNHKSWLMGTISLK